MTKRDYVLLADTIRKVRATLSNASPLAKDYYSIAMDVFTESLCTVLGHDNEKFDKDKFLSFIQKGK